MTASLRLVTMVAALLLSLTSLAPLTSAAPASPQPDVAAAQLRRKGEEAMILGQYDKAIEHFTALIALDPSPASYLKRAAVSQRRRDWSGVISDATAAVAAAAADPASDQARIKALSLRGQALTHRGECEAAVPDLVAAGPEAAQHLDRAQRCASAFATLTAARARMPAAFTSSSASAANGAAAVERVPPQLRAQLMDALDGVISLQLGTPDDYLERARLNFALGKYHEAIMDTRNVLQARAESIPALLLRGDAYYMLSEHPNAVTHYKKGLGSDPEHRELQKRFKNVRKIMKKLEEAEEASQRGQHVKAVEAYAAAAAIDKRQRPILDEIDVKTCAALLKANGKGKDALAACQRVADKPGASAEAWCQVGEAHMVMEQWAAAEQVFTKAMQMDQNSRAAREGVQRAQLEAKKASRKDYYKILGVGKKAGKREIKKAYLKLAKQFHPDMVSGEKEKEEAEARFHDVGEAYEILSDDEKRGRYDRGEDIEMPQGRPRGGQGFPFPFANFGGGGGGGAFHFSFG